VLVPDDELDTDRLVAEVDTITALDGNGVPRFRSMATAAASLAHPDAAERVADLVEQHARRVRPRP
jgi:UDP-N-acetylglucosamine:LPS N-acetylglucosamine transferase